MSKLLGICGFAGSGKDTVGDILVEYGYTKIAFADPIKRAVMDWYGFTEEQLWGSSFFRNLPDKRYFRGKDFKVIEKNIKKGKSPFMGVRWDEGEGKWQVYTWNKICSTFYEQEEEAAVSYDEIVTKIMGEYAILNSDLFLTPRKALQIVGTEIGREIYASTWVDYTLRIAKELNDNPYASYIRTKGVLRDEAQCSSMRRKGVIITDVRFCNEIEKIKEKGGKIIKILREDAGLKGNAGNHQSEKEMLEMKSESFDYIIDNNGTIEELKQNITHFIKALK